MNLPLLAVGGEPLSACSALSTSSCMHEKVQRSKVWWQAATLFVYFSYFITCIHSFIQSHSYNTIIHRHLLRPLSISSSLVCSVGKHLLWCRAENRTRACLTASRRATNWAAPHHAEPRRTTKRLVFPPGLRIRIHFIRIRIQHFRLNSDPDPDPIRIQGFNDQKLEKNYSWKFFYIFLIKNYNLPIPRPP